MRKRFFHFGAGCVAIAAIVLLVSFTTKSSSNKVSISKPVSGEEYYKAIFFSQGDLANQIPELKQAKDMIERLGSTDAKLVAAQQEFQEKIVALIKKDAPDFFNEFGKAVVSKNPLAIYNQLNQGNAITKAAFFNYVKNDPSLTPEMQANFENNADKIKDLVNKYKTNMLSFADYHKELSALLATKATSVEEQEEALIFALNLLFAVNVYFYINIQAQINISIEYYVQTTQEIGSTAAVFSQFENQLTLEKFAKSIADHI